MAGASPRRPQGCRVAGRLAADRGDPNAIFALAMFTTGGEATGTTIAEAARLLAAAAKPAVCVSCLRSRPALHRRPAIPQDPSAAELFRIAAQAGNPEAQYALATLYKDGRGVAKDEREAARLLERRRPKIPTPRSNCWDCAIQRTGVPKNEVAAAKYPSSARRSKAARSRRTASPTCWRPGAASPPIPWPPFDGT